MSARSTHAGLSWAGLYGGPIAWGINTQANYAAVPWVCAHKGNLIPVVSLALAFIALLTAFFSWRAFAARGGMAAVEGPNEGRPSAMVAGIGVLTGILFAVVILTQGAAALILDGCER